MATRAKQAAPGLRKAIPQQAATAASPAAAQEPPPVKLPKTLGATADLYWRIREQRYALDRQSAELKKQESYIRDFFIDNLPKSDATGVTGKLCRITAVQKTGYAIDDYDKFTEYVARNRSKGSFALLNRALNAKAVKELYEAGRTVPGVKAAPYADISVNKV